MRTSAALSSLVHTSQALRAAACEGSFRFDAFLDALKRQAATLSRYKLPGEHVDNLLEKLKLLAEFERPLGPIGASALLRKLEAWHLLPPADQDAIISLRRYRQEIDYEKKVDWESEEIDYSKFHPIRDWEDDFKDGGGLGDRNYESYLRRKISISGYHRLDLVDKGGGGMLFEAESESEPSKKVAIKVFPMGWTHDIFRYVYFENNLSPKLAAIAEHSALLVVASGAGFTNLGDPYVIMEYVKGSPLSTKRRVKDFSRVLTIGNELISGIASLHREGLIHGDISPRNILISNHRPRLIDFDGLTHEMEFRRGQLTDPGGEGLPGYSAPELWNGFPLNFRTDVFGLSASLYLLLTGKEPFGELAVMMALGFSERDEIETELKKPALPPRKLNHRISPGLSDVLLRGLALDPAERHENAIHFQEEFCSRLTA